MVKKIKNDKSENFIYRNFKLGLKYIGESKNYIIFSFLLFLLFTILGFLFPVFFEEQILSYIKELVDKTKGFGPLDLIIFIINNNILSSFYALAFGILFGIIPFFILVVNGYVLGFVANKVVLSQGIMTLWRLFPHGIFEIPAIMISAGIGMKLGTSFMKTKEKLRGFFGILVFFAFLILYLMIFSILVSLFAGTNDPLALQEFYKSFANNGLVIFFIILISTIFIFISIFASLQVFSKNEKNRMLKKLKFDIKNSLRAFIFVVIPLLVIAGIVEGVLISMLG